MALRFQVIKSCNQKEHNTVDLVAALSMIGHRDDYYDNANEAVCYDGIPEDDVMMKDLSVAMGALNLPQEGKAQVDMLEQSLKDCYATNLMNTVRCQLREADMCELDHEVLYLLSSLDDVRRNCDISPSVCLCGEYLPLIYVVLGSMGEDMRDIDFSSTGVDDIETCKQAAKNIQKKEAEDCARKADLTALIIRMKNFLSLKRDESLIKNMMRGNLLSQALAEDRVFFCNPSNDKRLLEEELVFVQFLKNQRDCKKKNPSQKALRTRKWLLGVVKTLATDKLEDEDYTRHHCITELLKHFKMDMSGSLSFLKYAQMSLDEPSEGSLEHREADLWFKYHHNGNPEFWKQLGDLAGLLTLIREAAQGQALKEDEEKKKKTALAQKQAQERAQALAQELDQEQAQAHKQAQEMDQEQAIDDTSACQLDELQALSPPVNWCKIKNEVHKYLKNNRKILSDKMKTGTKSWDPLAIIKPVGKHVIKVGMAHGMWNVAT